MGTSNFHSVNANRTFAALMTETVNVKTCSECEHVHTEHDYNLETLHECKECGHNELIEGTEDRCPDEWEYNDLLDCLRDALKEKFGRDYTEDDATDNNRSYNGRYFASVSSSRNFMRLDVEVQIKCLARAGYYDGVSLDWEPVIYIDGTVNEDIQDAETSFRIACDYEQVNEGLQRANWPKLENWLEATKEHLTSEIEKVYEAFSTPLNVVARFSNGETIYSKA
jgi:hypothetical protein